MFVSDIFVFVSSPGDGRRAGDRGRAVLHDEGHQTAPGDAQTVSGPLYRGGDVRLSAYPCDISFSVSVAMGLVLASYVDYWPEQLIFA